ncbi:hypothetical protein Cgig2_030951 [Carnegiea gigantea]|uniref:Uncharacterized protein n=1 Tax=Carnegiea gigantea TaxID=171969 RepID=A0A9Q1GXD9_9CARY|nr:hypothetical protein Cgig2_030951 [Carnegiea gigantea]
MIFDIWEACSFGFPHDDLGVIELKVANARRILIGTGSSTDIITSDYLQKLKHPRRDTPLVHPILGFGRQSMAPVSAIYLPLQFGDKTKSRNLDVDFLVADIPIAYNVILGCPTWHIIKAIIVQIQYDADYDNFKKLSGISGLVENAIWSTEKALVVCTIPSVDSKTADDVETVHLEEEPPAYTVK